MPHFGRQKRTDAGGEAAVLRAKVVLTRADAIENAGVWVEGGVVKAVGDFAQLSSDMPSLPVRDLGEVALLPGFVNAHVHLELSHLCGKTPFTGSFAAWIGAVGDEGSSVSRRQLEMAATEGVAESRKFGTAVVGDVGLRGRTSAPLAEGGLGGVVFSEAIGLDPRICRRMLWWTRRRIATSKKTERLRPGISPHAPYTTSAELYRACLYLARHWRLPLMTHAAETKEEEEFVRKGTGPLIDLAKKRGWLKGKWEPPGQSPVEYLVELGVLAPVGATRWVARGCNAGRSEASRGLEVPLGTSCRAPTMSNVILAHLNYPSPTDVELVAKSGASVAFCPRSHRFFRHDPYPLSSLLSAGINVCLGTDSLASNDSLSVLEEARLVAKDFPGLSPRRVFDLATVNGAQALGLAGKVGEIAPGAWASLLTLDIAPLGSAIHGDAVLDFLLQGGDEPTPLRV